MRVLFFGTFDPLHGGHVDAFRQARELGDELAVVVARDSYIRQMKEREPHENEQERLEKVLKNDFVDDARLGQEWPVKNEYELLRELDFDILAVGYDQEFDKERVGEDVKIVRLKPYKEDVFKSTKLRKI